MKRLVAAFLSALVLGASRAPIYPDTTAHRTVTTRAVDLATEKFAQYREIAIYDAPLVDGCVAEDSGSRFLQHFYDPNTGLGLTMNSYTVLFELERLPETLPSTRYQNALDWGTDGKGNDYSWRDAIEHYDSTHEAKHRAYLALGYVVHLLQDMASPDHATSRTHPGNYVANYVPGFAERVLLPRDRVGYEQLWEKLDKQWPAGTTVDKPTSLKQAFDDMGREAQAEEKKHGFLQKPDEIALGLDRLRVHNQLGVGSETSLQRDLRATYIAWTARQLEVHDDAFWATYELNIPLIPRIPYPLTAASQPYVDVGNRLLLRAEERSAGLLQFYHDIVNLPPYVMSVEIRQLGEVRYRAAWEEAAEGGRVTGRTLVRGDSVPLRKGEQAQVRIVFGPRWKDMRGEPHGEPLKEVRVTLGDREVFGAVASGLAMLSPSEWNGSFAPEKGGRITIEARDAQEHLADRSPPGDELDANPATPARATFDGANYGWSAYEAGADTNHAVRVEGEPEDECVRGAFSDELRKSLVWCEWSGAASRTDEGADIEEAIAIGGRGTADATYVGSARAQVKFRGTAWPEGEAVEFGGSSGSFTFTYKRERVYRADGSRGQTDKSSSGPVEVTGSLQLRPNAAGMQEIILEAVGEGTPNHREVWSDSGDA